MKRQNMLFLALSLSSIQLVQADSWLVGVYNKSPYDIKFDTNEAGTKKTSDVIRATIKELNILEPGIEREKLTKTLIPWHTDKGDVKNYYISAKVMSKEPTTHYLQERYELGRGSHVFIGELQGRNGVFGEEHPTDKEYVLFFDTKGEPSLFEKDSLVFKQALRRANEERECAELKGLARTNCLRRQTEKHLKEAEKIRESVKKQAESMKK